MSKKLKLASEDSPTYKLLSDGYIIDQCGRKTPLQNYNSTSVEDTIMCSNEFITFFYNLLVERGMSDADFINSLNEFIIEQTGQIPLWEKVANPLDLDLPNFRFPGFPVYDAVDEYYREKKVQEEAETKPAKVDLEIDIVKHELDFQLREELRIREQIRFLRNSAHSDSEQAEYRAKLNDVVSNPVYAY